MASGLSVTNVAWCLPVAADGDARPILGAVRRMLFERSLPSRLYEVLPAGAMRIPCFSP